MRSEADLMGKIDLLTVLKVLAGENFEFLIPEVLSQFILNAKEHMILFDFWRGKLIITGRHYYSI